MKKIDCLFIRQHFDTKTGEWVNKRNPNTIYKATPEVTPGCEWVMAGEGNATIKWDGTAVMIRKVPGETFLYQRLTLKDGSGRGCGQMAVDNTPEDWIKADDRLELGREIWWVPATDKWIIEAFKNSGSFDLPDGTYEAIGPKINGNRQKLDKHILRKHGDMFVAESMFKDPLYLRTYEGLRDYLGAFEGVGGYFHEGLVFHHPDGRMAKITRRDLGWGDKGFWVDDK